MTKKDDGGQAFPRSYISGNAGGGGAGGGGQPSSSGMSLRDYFAGQALTGILGNPQTPKTANKNGRISFVAVDASRAAYEAADAMIAERAK